MVPQAMHAQYQDPASMLAEAKRLEPKQMLFPLTHKMYADPAHTISGLQAQGQDPFPERKLDEAKSLEPKQMLGEFALVHNTTYTDLAGKISGLRLVGDNSELLHLLESHESLTAKVTI